jgi:EmrB/QacA subfamily drug resistance transporter
MSTSLDQPGREAPANGHRHLGIALLVISIAQLMVVLDATIANIAIPYIAEDLDFSKSSQTWIITGYTLAFGGLLLLGGRLGDMFGRRRVFMLGVTIFAVASMLGGLAQSEGLLLAARGLQGLGAAIASPTALALITTTFPAGKLRNRAFAVYAAMSGAGAAVGLILGGWLTDHSWRWTFLINVPIGVAAAVLAPMVLAESEPRRVKLDLPGALSGTFGLLSIVYGLTRAADPTHGWSDLVTISSLVIGAVLLVAFVVIERTVSEPLMPFHILADRTRGTSFLVMFLFPAAMFAMFYFLSVTVQNAVGYSPIKTGFAFLPFTIGIVASAAIASNLMSRVDPRWLSGFGGLLAAVGLWGFSQLPYETSDLSNIGVPVHYVSDLLPWILAMSFGMGFLFVPLTVTAVHGVDTHESGIGSAVLNAMQQVGGALGLAVLSTVAVHAATDRGNEIAAAAQANPQAITTDQATFQHDAIWSAFTYGATRAFEVGAIMFVISAVIAMVFLNVRHEEINNTDPMAELDDLEPIPATVD